MKRRTTRRAAAAALSLLALTLAGCGSTDGDGGAGTGAAAEEEVELGPLEEYFQEAYGEYDEDQANRDMRLVEEIVADCMAEQGFDYTPMDVTTQGASFEPEELDVEWGTLEFAEQYGYGITTNPYGDMEEAVPTEEFVDPNAEYVESMSESEREAFYVALSGEQPTAEEMEAMESAEFEYDWEQAGCQGRAQHEVYEGGETDEATASLEEEMNAVWEQTQQDPRLTEVTTAWVDCMADAGITGLATVDDASRLISDKANAVYEESFPTDPEAMPSPEEMADVEAQVQERLAAITDEEIDTAVADFTCREELGYEDTLREVSVDLQQQFVDTHREELEAWVEATASRR